MISNKDITAVEKFISAHDAMIVAKSLFEEADASWKEWCNDEDRKLDEVLAAGSGYYNLASWFRNYLAVHHGIKQVKVARIVFNDTDCVGFITTDAKRILPDGDYA